MLLATNNNMLVCRPLGVVYFVLESIRLSEEQMEDGAIVFVVFKCGPHWGRTQAARSTASPVFNWEVGRLVVPQACASQSRSMRSMQHE